MLALQLEQRPHRKWVLQKSTISKCTGKNMKSLKRRIPFSEPTIGKRGAPHVKAPDWKADRPRDELSPL